MRHLASARALCPHSSCSFVPGRRTDGDVTSMGVLACGFCEKGHSAFLLLGRHICPSAPVFIFGNFILCQLQFTLRNCCNCIITEPHCSEEPARHQLAHLANTRLARLFISVTRPAVRVRPRPPCPTLRVRTRSVSLGRSRCCRGRF